jgi:hypothetical protein
MEKKKNEKNGKNEKQLEEIFKYSTFQLKELDRFL